MKNPQNPIIMTLSQKKGEERDPSREAFAVTKEEGKRKKSGTHRNRDVKTTNGRGKKRLKQKTTTKQGGGCMKQT